MKWLVSTALSLRAIVVALAILLIVLGIRASRETPLDVFPEFAPPIVEIQTEVPGLSTEEVESLVTMPLENSLNGISWLKTLRSKSVLGLSSVVLIFREGTDLLRARQLVQERLSVAEGGLPAAARAPVILPPLSSTSRILKIGVSSATLSQMDLTEIARWTIRPRLMAVPGVANVAIWGQRDRQYQVIVDPDRLRARGVTLDTVVRSAADASALGLGGFVDTPNQRMAIRHVSPIETAEELAEALLERRNGSGPVRLGDVADVQTGFPPPIGDAVINDGPGLLLIVEKQPSANTLEVTRQVDAALEALRPGLAGVDIDATIFRPARFIETSLENLRRALLLGCIFVVVVLVAFLQDWRTALISALAIPLSLLAAAVVLHARGGTIDTMVLAGLVIALGEVVDDAIIDVENIARRLALNRTAGSPRTAFDVVLAASLEVRSAVVFASLIVILVFLPVFFLGGLAGSFFRPLAFSYAIAILASMVVALTVTPALSLILLTGARRSREAPLARFLKAGYRRLLPPLVARPRALLVFLVVAFAATVAAGARLGEEFLPSFRERDFLMHWVEKPGTSLDAMRRVTERASRELRSVPGVRNFGAHIGRAEVADEVVGPNFTELWISIDDGVDYASTVRRIQDVVDGYPGLYRDLLTYLKERIKEVLTGASATLVVRIYGPDLDVLRSKAREVAAAVDVPGTADLKVEPQVLVPQVRIRLRPEDALRHGVRLGDVRRASATLLQGTKVGEVYREQRIHDVVVRGAEGLRTDIGALRALPIDTPGGAQVALGEVADVWIAPAPNEVKRENASRRIDVTCNIRGRDLGAIATAVRERVLALDFPRGYHPEFLGEYAARQEARNRLFAFAGLAFVGIVLLLHADFRSVRLTALVVLSLPFALIGGVAGAFLSGGVLSLGSLVGFVTVLGIAARNGILLVSHYRHLSEVEGEAFGPSLVLRGAEERLVPILMTALCAGLGILPLALGGNLPGHEIEYPMAVVILGGLVTSTALNLFLLPVLFGAFGRSGRPSVP